MDDLVEGICRLSQCDCSETVNLGNPEEITILDFAKEVIELTVSESNIVFKELPADDPQIRQPDIKRAKKMLNWEPEVKRRYGLVKTLEYFKKQIN